MPEVEKISVVGLGYVGLPLAAALARRFAVVGCDANPERVAQLQNGGDSSGEVSGEDLAAVSQNLTFTANIADARECQVFIIAVPTPILPDRRPDLSVLESACRSVGTVLKPNDLVVVESTVYPGVTEEICAPILENESGLTFNRDFACGYSPERLRPGTAHRNLSEIVKVTAGSTPEAAARTDAIYKRIIRAGTFPAESIRAAEAAKVLENVQRDINIAVMNEAALMCEALNLDSRAVFAAAASKWDFLNFQPGLVGGHCIGVDPYYLSHKAQACGYRPDLLLAARKINDAMGGVIAARTLALLRQRNSDGQNFRVSGAGLHLQGKLRRPAQQPRLGHRLRVARRRMRSRRMRPRRRPRQGANRIRRGVRNGLALGPFPQTGRNHLRGRPRRLPRDFRVGLRRRPDN